EEVATGLPRGDVRRNPARGKAGVADHDVVGSEPGRDVSHHAGWLDRNRVAGLGLSPQLGRVAFDALRFCEPLGPRLLLDERQQGGMCGSHIAAQLYSVPGRTYERCWVAC